MELNCVQKVAMVTCIVLAAGAGACIGVLMGKLWDDLTTLGKVWLSFMLFQALFIIVGFIWVLCVR